MSLHLEITKEIVIALIQNDKIGRGTSTIPENLEELYTDEVCKTFEAIYQTVSKVEDNRSTFTFD